MPAQQHEHERQRHDVRSNHGGPTDALSPVTASEISGKNVPQKIDEASADEHEVVEQEDRLAREQRVEPVLGAQRRRARDTTSAIEPAIITAISDTNGTPSVEAPNAWIESRMPERTRNVPRIASMPVASTSETFQIFSIPRFSWIITECRNAVPVSHGISEAFSTGSQAQ